MSFQLKNRVALVTGSGRGIGAAIATRLSEAGATVYLADLHEKGAQDVAASICASNGRARVLSFDVTDGHGWETAIEVIKKESGRLDALVNNVGITISKSVEETTTEDWRLMMKVNLEAPFIGVKAALPLMKESAKSTPFGGSIVNMSSVSGIVGTPNLSCYTASKGGLRFFSKSAAIEFARAGYRIRVNTVHPGLTEGDSATVLFQSAVDSGRSKTIAEAQELWTARYPMNRMARQEDIAEGVLFLVCDESNYMTGTELIMDGGLSA
ncbi:3(or 17)beta-hydroxysteroid dehydrogenase [Nitrobacteraceae bacterium AZCC 2146]